MHTFYILDSDLVWWIQLILILVIYAKSDFVLNLKIRYFKTGLKYPFEVLCVLWTLKSFFESKTGITAFRYTNNIHRCYCINLKKKIHYIRPRTPNISLYVIYNYKTSYNILFLCFSYLWSTSCIKCIRQMIPFLFPGYTIK